MMNDYYSVHKRYMHYIVCILSMPRRSIVKVPILELHALYDVVKQTVRKFPASPRLLPAPAAAL